MKIEIHHPNGHVTKVPISLSTKSNLMIRLKEDEETLRSMIESIEPHLTPGTKVYLVIKSKANNEH